MIKTLFKNRLFLPIVILAAVIAGFVVNASGIYRFPVISSIEPDVAYPGENIRIIGSNFGSVRSGVEVRIAGVRAMSNDYEKWSDNEIIVRIPEDADSGLVTVKTRRKVSNGVLFTNREHIPVILSGPQKPGYPYMESLSPESGSVGSLLTIKGLNFGHERGTAEVFFAAAGLDEEAPGGDDSLAGMIVCSEIDYDYDSWDDQQINVFIPDGASSGNIRIQTDRGISNALYFEVEDNSGIKNYTDKKGYQIEYGVDINRVDGNVSNSLDLWIPVVRPGLEQRNVETTTEPAPLWENYLGLMRYSFSDITDNETKQINIQTWFECYAIETRVNTAKVQTRYNEDRRLFKVYTQAETLIPSGDDTVKRWSSSAVGRERNPYRKAENIYNYLLKNLEYSLKPASTLITENINSGEGDSYTYSVLFAAMCRAAGIPARPVAGVLIYNNKQSINHYWAEFYLEGYGWIPVDPALGDGARFGNFPLADETQPASYYFGSLDNQHLTFTRGVIPVRQIAPEGKIVTRKGLFSLQTIYEESAGLFSYSSLWRSVRVVNWW